MSLHRKVLPTCPGLAFDGSSPPAGNHPTDWGILAQCSMISRLIIVGCISAQDPAQVRFAEHNHMVETFPSDRTDQSSRRTHSATAIGVRSADRG